MLPYGGDIRGTRAELSDRAGQDQELPTTQDYRCLLGDSQTWPLRHNQLELQDPKSQLGISGTSLTQMLLNLQWSFDRISLSKLKILYIKNAFCICTGMGAEGNLRRHSSTETWSLTGLRFTKQARLASLQALRIHLSPPLQQ